VVVLPLVGGVPRQLGGCAGRSELGNADGQALGGADRHGRLADDERVALQVRGQAVDDGVEVAEVGGTGSGSLRGADAHEMHVGKLGRCGQGRAEP
jgi:hypothetical protein